MVQSEKESARIIGFSLDWEDGDGLRTRNASTENTDLPLLAPPTIVAMTFSLIYCSFGPGSEFTLKFQERSFARVLICFTCRKPFEMTISVANTDVSLCVAL